MRALPLWLALIGAPAAAAPLEDAPAAPGDDLSDLYGLLETLARSGYPDVAAARLVEALYRQPDHPDAPLVRLRLADFQRDHGNPVGAVWTLRQGLDAHPDLAAAYQVAIADVYLQEGLWDELLDVLARLDPPAPGAASPLAFYEGWAHVGRGHPERAVTALSRVDDPLAPAAAAFARELAAAGTPATRSPTAASTLSIVPGAGHVYAGAPGRGLASFALVAALGTGAALLYDEELPVAATGVALVGVGTWLSTAADAGRRARRFNARQVADRVGDHGARWWIRATPTDDPADPIAVRPGPREAPVGDGTDLR